MSPGTSAEFTRHAYPARAARRSDCGGWPKARMKARRIRSGSRKPVVSATRSIASPEDCTRCRATSIRNRSTAFDGVVPVAAMKARAKCRELMPACSAMSSTVKGGSRCSRAQANSGPNRPERRLQFQQRGELRLAAAAAVVEHELARGLLRDLVAVILRHHRQRQIDAGGDAGRTPDIAVADEDPVGLQLYLG